MGSPADVQSVPDVAPSLLRAQESQQTEIPYLTAFRCTATFDIPPQTAANER